MNPSRHLIPRGEGRGLLQRLGIVVAVALAIAGIQFAFSPRASTGLQGFSVALVYSLSISVAIWAAIDPVRYLLRGLLRAEAPGYWPPPGRAVALVAVGTLAGYTLGTLVGDAWAGRSTLELLQRDQRRFYALLASSAAVSIGFVAYFYQRGHREALEHQAREARLALLQSQLEPHMLFNTLANLRVLIATDAPRAQAMLDHLIGFLRATLAASRSAEHPLRAEFERLGDYLALMQVRMGPRLVVRLELPAALAGHPVPPLLLQPLVENAIRHGLEPRPEGGSLEVSASLEGGQLRLRVRDSGVGLAPAQPGAAGFGLTQVRERLQTRYGAAAHLRLEPLPLPPGGTLATITLPREHP
jgi:signal transduction histidine kinase